MKNVEIVITNNRIPELKRRFPQIVQDIVDKTAFDVQKFAMESMQEPKSGRVYSRGGKSHQASAPGEAPAIDMGLLVNTIGVASTEPGEDIVFVNAEYGVPLEFGTKDGHIAARPFMTPAAEKARPKFLQALKQLEARLK